MIVQIGDLFDLDTMRKELEEQQKLEEDKQYFLNRGE